MLRPILTLPLLFCLVCACHKDAPIPEEAATTPLPAAGSSAPAPISAHGGTVADSQPAAAAASGSIDFDLPKDWTKQEPSSTMRLFQASIPGPGGPVDFAVFFFGPGGGGTVEANVERWLGQVETSDHPKPQTFEASGLKVTWVDVKGTLKASQMGPGPSAPVSDGRLYGAVVEGPGGPWFFKAQGPDKTLAPQRDAFVAMLKSVRAKA
ncbi:MAG TPA: hypothetical protein VF173_18140 [Thermoanaerobaculia bacterium]|nr:hypothetical protein [Thermoanaerobaculia bacterium]